MNNIEKKCIEKMEEGQKKYGVFDPVNDRRNLYDEMEAELIDVINYAKMQIEKIRILKQKYESSQSV